MAIPDWVRSWEFRMPVCSSQSKQSLLISGVNTRNARSAYIVAQNIVAQWHAVSYKLPFTYCSYPRDSAWVPVTIRSPEPWATSGYRWLTHRDGVKHKCASKFAIIGLIKDLSPLRCQAIIRTNIGLLSTGTLGICINESFDANMTISFWGNAFEITVCKIATLFSRSQYINGASVVAAIMKTVPPQTENRFTKCLWAHKWTLVNILCILITIMIT